MIVQLIDFLKEKQQTVRAYGYIVLGLILIWSVTGVDLHHAHTWAGEHIPVFWAIFGLLSCAVLIYFARWVGKSGIMTREDYYDN